LVVLIVNFFFVIIHMLMATRFIMNCEFMLNVKEVGGRPLRPEAGRWEGGRVGGREGGREGGRNGGSCKSVPPPPPVTHVHSSLDKRHPRPHPPIQSPPSSLGPTCTTALVSGRPTTRFPSSPGCWGRGPWWA
jgi:hypothetical protein